jgi:pimeloyl-ACP methyl ester carboxylesterase
MTLNATVFPDLGLTTISPEFNRLCLGVDGSTAELLEDRMDFYARLLGDFLDQSGEWQAPRRIIVAHSFGGMLGLRWLGQDTAGSEPPAGGLVLISTTAGPMYEKLSLRLGLGELGIRFPGGPVLPLWNHPWVTRAIKWIMCGGSLDTGEVDFRTERIESDLSLDLAGWRNTDWRAMRSYRLAMQGFDVRERLSEIRIPAIVLHGTKDSLFDVESGRELADGLPDAGRRRGRPCVASHPRRARDSGSGGPPGPLAGHRAFLFGFNRSLGSLDSSSNHPDLLTHGT